VFFDPSIDDHSSFVDRRDVWVGLKPPARLRLRREIKGSRALVKAVEAALLGEDFVLVE
jgi:hypothetical protein